MARVVSPEFVGREQELALASAMVRDLAVGRSSVLVVGGEAGIGKTRLVAEYGRTAERAGARVLVGACLELSAEGLALAPLAGALRTLLREVGEQRFTELVGEVEEFAGLLPELGVPPTRSRSGQGRLFALTRRVLERLAATRPVAFVVEDLHWADRSTLDLVAFLVRGLRHAPVAFMITFRSDELDGRTGLRPLLTELDRLDHVTRLELPRLSRRAVAAQLRALLEAAPSAALVRRVFTRSDGNPFFVEELAGGDAPTAGGDAPLPSTLREILLARARRLPETARRVLRLACVAGPAVSHALLAELSGLDEETLIDAVRAARDGHVLVADPDDGGYAFRHALVREALYADLLPAERIRWHVRLAEAVERRPDLVGAGRVQADVARHWHAAGRDREALPAAVRAATEAGRQYAYAEQYQLLERAIELHHRLGGDERGPGDVDCRLDRLYEVAGAAAFEAGQLDRALQLVDAALAVVDGGSEPERVAALLILRSRLLRMLGRDGAVAAARQAAALVPAAGPTRGAVLAHLAFSLQIAVMVGAEPDLAEARRRSEEALALARRFADRATEAWARIVLGSVLVNLDDLDAGIGQSRSGVAAAAEVQDDLLYARGTISLSDALELAGRYTEAVEIGRAALRHLERVGLLPTWFGAALTGNLGDALLRLGRWDEVDEITAAALDRDPPGVYASHLYQLRGDLAAARGDLRSAAAHRDTFAGLIASEHPVVHEQLALARLSAEILLWEGRPEEAAERTAVPLRAGLTPGAGHRAWPVLSLGARAVAEATERRRNLGAGAAGRSLSGVADLLRDTTARLPRPTARAQLHAALVDAQLGRTGGCRDPAAWRAALDAAELVGDPYALGYTLTGTARALLAARRRDEAATALRRAAGLADHLGAAPLRRYVDRIGRQVRIRRSARRPEHTFGFTDREQQVAELVGRGMTNQEIAERLFVSAKTVEYHLGKIYTKLGVGTRRELRAYVQG